MKGSSIVKRTCKNLKHTLTFLTALLLAPLAAVQAAEVAPVAVSYRLPVDGPLPKTYRVTLAIVDAHRPEWIVSQFAAGVARTVTAENGGQFSEVWNGLDDNFMPVPPGEYGVKGIYMPAEVWAADGQPHTLRAKLHGGPFALTPKPGAGENGPCIEGDPVGKGMGDVDVGPDGIAFFYWQFLENGRNPYPVDLTRPLGPGQLHSGFGSGGTGGGNHVATDGKTVWAVAPDDDLVRTSEGEAAFLYPPFLFRADEKPFGRDDMIRRNEGWLDGVVVTGGEPTLHDRLPDLLSHFRRMNLHTKIYTNGTRATMLAMLIERGLVDAVAMDVKAPLDDRYDRCAGVEVNLDEVRRCIEMLIASDLEYSFCTTVCPPLLSEEDVMDTARALRGAREYILNKFTGANCIDPALNDTDPYPPDTMHALAAAAEKYVQKCVVRGDYSSHENRG